MKKYNDIDTTEARIAIINIPIDIVLVKIEYCFCIIPAAENRPEIKQTAAPHNKTLEALSNPNGSSEGIMTCCAIGEKMYPRT